MQNKAWRVAVISASDKGSRGEREDESGALISQFLRERGFNLVYYKLLPDEQNLIEEELRRIADLDEAELVLTTGGTGFSPRDTTPEATLAVAERLVPGIAEAMRLNGLNFTKRAMLSRAVSVIRKQTLIINLPGSPKAVMENLEFIADELQHALEILRAEASECARK